LTTRRVGITKQIGWHTFRRTYSSLLAATGDNVKVVQESMRHAKISTTMEVYAQAGMEKKRVAQRRAVDVLLDRKPKNASMEQSETGWSQVGLARSRMLPEVAV
jgi:integrase